MPRDAIACDPLADVVVRHLGLAVRAERVAEVDDLQPVEDLQPEIHVVGAGLVGGGPDRPRTEPRTGPVRRRDVERCADDRDVGLPGVELFDLGQERPVPERRETRVGQVELLGHSRRQVPLRPVIMVIAHARDSTGLHARISAIQKPVVTSPRIRRTSPAQSPIRQRRRPRRPYPGLPHPGARSPYAPRRLVSFRPRL